MSASAVSASSPVRSSSPRVLFLHGLESGPHGLKSKYLQANFEHYCCPSISSPFLFPLVFYRVLRSIAAFQPDILVGSSYGGFVLLTLIQSGLWTGPAVMLAPATGLLFHQRLYIPPSYQYDPFLLILHSNDDAVCPVLHSLRLVTSVQGGASGKIRLIRPNGEDHSLNRYCVKENRLKGLIEEVYHGAVEWELKRDQTISNTENNTNTHSDANTNGHHQSHSHSSPRRSYFLYSIPPYFDTSSTMASYLASFCFYTLLPLCLSLYISTSLFISLLKEPFTGVFNWFKLVILPRIKTLFGLSSISPLTKRSHSHNHSHNQNHHGGTLNEIQQAEKLE